MRYFHLVIELEKQNSYQESAEDASEVFVPQSLFQSLPFHLASSSTRRRNTLKAKPRRQDHRFGHITIDWVDFDRESNDMLTAKDKGLARISTTLATYIPSASGSTNLPDGIVHIYRDGDGGSVQQQMIVSSPSTSKPIQPNERVDKEESVDECMIVAVLGVPPWMNPADFLAFVAPAGEGMAHLRLIRDAAPNRTMVVIQFRDPSSVPEFIAEFNGRPFNSLEPETCNVVRVKSVKIDFDDPVSPVITRSSTHSGLVYELPTCPVCLDRMDATVTGLVTVPCSHTFHCMCLSKWGDSRCPVCRYSQNALLVNARATEDVFPPLNPPSIPSMSACFECDSRFNLWICLICGNIGCGRQGRAHAKGHYELTMHAYALELETQRVWDYLGDNYVHRLIQSKADGKLVELPSASNMEVETNAKNRSGLGPGAEDDLKAEKVEIMAMQYSQILQRALDDQRQSYEEQISGLTKSLEETQKKLEILSINVQNQALDFREAQDRRQKEEEERRVQSEKERSKVEKKAEKLTELARKLEKELKEERAVSDGLMLNLAKMKERVEVADKEKADSTVQIEDLQDQLRDMMFYIDASTKIGQGEGMGAEAAGGSIELPPVPSPSLKAQKKKKKKAR